MRVLTAWLCVLLTAMPASVWAQATSESRFEAYRRESGLWIQDLSVAENPRNLPIILAQNDELTARCRGGRFDVCVEAIRREYRYRSADLARGIAAAACDRAHGESCHSLAFLQANVADGMRYLELSCTYAFAEACWKVGRILGEGPLQDQWFDAACNSDPAYCLKVANEGRRPREEYASWVERGCAYGDTPSCEALEKLRLSWERERRRREFEVIKPRVVQAVARDCYARLQPIVHELAQSQFIYGRDFSDMEPSYPSRLIGFRYRAADGSDRSFVCGSYTLDTWLRSNPDWEHY